MIVSGGRTTYGQEIGILMLNTNFPRIPGDIGNAETFSYPVRYRVVERANTENVVKQGDEAMLEPFIREAEYLIGQGAKAIVTSCGFMAKFQKEMARALPVPVYSSSLLQVPLVYAMLRPDQKVGILTADSHSLSEAHFKGAGIEGIPKAVEGIQDTYFGDVIFRDRTELDVERAKKDMEHAAGKLVEEHPEVGAIVLECTNMPPFAKRVAEVTGRPVFDIVTLTDYVHAALKPKSYREVL